MIILPAEPEKSFISSLLMRSASTAEAKAASTTTGATDTVMYFTAHALFVSQHLTYSCCEPVEI